MHKVLFISLSDYRSLGGTQNYNFKLMQIFKKLGWEIIEYNCNLGIDKIVRKDIPGINIINNSSVLKPSNNRFIEGIRFIHQVKQSNKELYEIIKNNNFDIIIDARQHPYEWKNKNIKDPAKSKNMIWVQHFSLGIYDGKQLSSSSIEKLFMYLYINKFSKYRSNTLYAHSNIVLFDKFNEQKININRFKNKNIKISKIQLSEYNKEYIENQKENLNKTIDFLYVGRINQVQKNINFINKTFKDFNHKLIMIGSGEKKFEKKILKNKNIEWLGFCNQDEIKKYFKLAKFLFLPSNYEGFPYVIVQALSHGCIPIILDTYESANFFNEIGKIYDKKISYIEMRKQLNILLSQYDTNQSIDAINFAKDNLSNEIFEQKWIDLINETINIDKSNITKRNTTKS